MKLWKEVAQELPVGRTTRLDCPQCGEGTNTNAAIVTHGIKGFKVHCFACDFNEFEHKGVQTLAEIKRLKELNDAAQRYATRKIELPEDFTYEIPLVGRLWLYSCGITPAIWKHHKIGWCGSLERVVLPVYDNEGTLKWFQLRAVQEGQHPKYIQPSADRSSILFLAPAQDENSELVVIVEDYASAARVANSGYNAISLLGTKATLAHLSTIAEYRNVIVWLDSDRAGRKGSYGLCKALSTVTSVRSVFTELDPKKYSNEQIKEIICTQLIKQTA